MRQQKILQIIAAKQVATQQELTEELSREGVFATQSSVSRDIVELGLTKLNGRYVSARPVLPGGPVVEIATAGDNLIVVKTDVGQASPAAVAIDRAKMDEIVGTVAGDDTIFIAVKDLEARRSAQKKLVKLFSTAAGRAESPRGKSRRAPANAL